MSFRNVMVLLAAVAASVVQVGEPGRQILPMGAQKCSARNPRQGH